MTTERRRNAPGKTSDLLQKGQTKKKGRSLNYEKQKILGSTDGRADGTGYGSLVSITGVVTVTSTGYYNLTLVGTSNVISLAYLHSSLA